MTSNTGEEREGNTERNIESILQAFTEERKQKQMKKTKQKTNKNNNNRKPATTPD